MPQIFPRKANVLPHLTLMGSLAGGVFAILFIWYYFSPEYTDVGYAPEQPVEYSHRLHAGQLGISCQYCHTNVKDAAHSNVPATQTCMNCHSQVRTDSPKLLPVRESWATGESIEWIKVHKLPDYAQFSHAVHTNNGVGCESCHGRIDQMEVVFQSEPLSMGWCLECHRNPEQFLRPNSEIATMGFDYPDDFVQQNLKRIEAENIQPPTNCSACHY
ncbi:MAG: cytochrome c3 family protein [Bacteroidetes bacterium]|nr:cytochrome c3 family protein [Bacteroidota bacterium]MDA1333242.1 cytochrome c3 family protein [Bacteroidota bacterium]